jgi:hypothetical protein
MSVPVTWYHAHIDAVSRSEGKSAVGLAAYMTGETLKDERTGTWCKRNHPGEVSGWGTVAPSGAQAYLTDDDQLGKAWNAVEASEKRINSHVANHWNLASSREFAESDHIDVAQRMAREISQRYGVMVTWAVHKPTDHGDDRNWHIHLGYNMRRVGPEGFGAKAREITDKKTRVEETIWQRKMFASVLNERLELIGSGERVSHETYDKQGIDLEPTKHLGNKQNQAELDGAPTATGEHNRAVKARNRRHHAELNELKAEQAKLTAEIIILEDERRKRAGKGSGMSDDSGHDQDERKREADPRLAGRPDIPAGDDNDKQVRLQQERLDHLRAERTALIQDQLTRGEELRTFETRREAEIREAERWKRTRDGHTAELERNGEPADAHSRYASALSASTTSADVYTVLSSAARAEYAAFAEKQDWYRGQEAQEADPVQRELLRTNRHIEWYEYRALTDRRIASYTQVATRNMDHPSAIATVQEADACEGYAEELREYRTQLSRQVREGVVEKFREDLANTGLPTQLVQKLQEGHEARKAPREELSQGTIPADEGVATERAVNRGGQGQHTRADLAAARETLAKAAEADERKDEQRGHITPAMREKIDKIRAEGKTTDGPTQSKQAQRGQNRGGRGR